MPGKTYFLVFALIQLLGNKQPVAFQPLSGIPCYLLLKDDVTLHYIWAPLHQFNFVWALSDANAHIQIPPAVFCGDVDRIRVIQTTSPKRSYWRPWSKDLDAWCYSMEIWTEEEVENLA